MKLLPKSLLEIKTEMKIINILIFVAAFIFVTVGLIYMNSMYNNIFKFDFSAIRARDSLTVASTISKNDPGIEINKQLDKKAPAIEGKDSTKNIDFAKDSVITPPPKAEMIPQVVPVQNKLTKTTEPPKKTEEQKSFQEKNVEPPVPVNENELVIDNSSMKSIVDTIYQKWIKQTAKLYESMDPKKAALIMKNYSETTARDIIYRMKKNKAAEVLSELDPLTANRIARFPGDGGVSAFIKN
jgi:hypothetical protein